LIHVVLHISDEYQIGTKKLGEQFNYPYSSLINMFFILNVNYALIEHINDKYSDDSLKYINHITRTKVNKFTISNRIIIKLYDLFRGEIKKLEYTNEDDELFDLDFVAEDDFYNIANESTVDRLTMLVNNRYISINSKGEITVDN